MHIVLFKRIPTFSKTVKFQSIKTNYWWKINNYSYLFCPLHFHCYPSLYFAHGWALNFLCLPNACLVIIFQDLLAPWRAFFSCLRISLCMILSVRISQYSKNKYVYFDEFVIIDAAEIGIMINNKRRKVYTLCNFFSESRRIFKQ